MACYSGPGSSKMENNKDYNPNTRGGACAEGCYNSAGDNQ
jgi:hypothetical protein